LIKNNSILRRRSEHDHVESPPNWLSNSQNINIMADEFPKAEGVLARIINYYSSLFKQPPIIKRHPVNYLHEKYHFATLVLSHKECLQCKNTCPWYANINLTTKRMKLACSRCKNEGTKTTLDDAFRRRSAFYFVIDVIIM